MADNDNKVSQQFDCKGNHRIVVNGVPMRPSSYNSPAFVVVEDKFKYVALTPYWEGPLPADACEKVYELKEVGVLEKAAAEYDFYAPGEDCPHKDASCPIEECPQKERRLKP